MTEHPETKMEGKLELAKYHAQLIPGGKPDYLVTIQYPKLGKLIEEHGTKNIIKSIFLLIKDFCNSFNVVRNMSEDQIIDCSMVIIQKYEKDNYRLEDFVQFFQAAKTGSYGKIYDRIDTQIIFEMLEVHGQRRYESGENHLNEIYDYADRNLSGSHQRQEGNELDSALMKLAGGFSAANKLSKEILKENGEC